MAAFFTFDRNYRPLGRTLDQSLFLATLFQNFFEIYFSAADICWIDSKRNNLSFTFPFYTWRGLPLLFDHGQTRFRPRTQRFAWRFQPGKCFGFSGSGCLRAYGCSGT